MGGLSLEGRRWRAVLAVCREAHLVRRGPVLVLGRLGADPEVHIPRELVGVVDGVLDVCVQDDVGVALVELAVLVLWPRLHLELLDSPHLQSHLDSGAVPLRLSVGGGGLDLLLDVGPKLRGTTRGKSRGNDAVNARCTRGNDAV